MGRSKEQNFLGVPHEDDFNSAFYDNFLNHLFTFGNIENKTFEIFDGFKVTLRVLTVAENIEVSRALDNEASVHTKEILLRVEVLVRAIVRINGQLLRFPDSEIEPWKDFRNTKENPSEIEQQRYYLRHKFSPELLHIIYEKYMVQIL